MSYNMIFDIILVLHICNVGYGLKVLIIFSCSVCIMKITFFTVNKTPSNFVLIYIAPRKTFAFCENEKRNNCFILEAPIKRIEFLVIVFKVRANKMGRK